MRKPKTFVQDAACLPCRGQITAGTCKMRWELQISDAIIVPVSAVVQMPDLLEAKERSGMPGVPAEPARSMY